MLLSPVRTVLLVDDSEDDIFLFQRAHVKAKADFNLRTAPSGRDAMNYLAGEGVFADKAAYPRPQLVVLDIKMPLVSGFDVLRWIRSTEAIKDLVVVMFSASMMESDLQKAYGLRANSYLVKPGDSLHLTQIVSLFEQYWMNTNVVPSVPFWNSAFV